MEQKKPDIILPEGVWPLILEAGSGTGELSRPLATLSENDDFPAWKRSDGQTLVIVNDGSRPTPTPEILCTDESFFCSEQVRYIVATGAHRAPAGDEWKQIFGPLYERVRARVHVHDARNSKEMRLYGETSFGTRVFYNRLLDDFEKVLVIGSVEPHYFAGYTGGRKGFLPGIAGYDTITANHRLALSPGSGLLKLEGNPVHMDMLEAVSFVRGKSVYSVMTVLNREQKIHSVYHGPLERAFHAAVKTAENVFTVDTEKAADIIITFASSPMNKELYQSQKAIENVRSILKPGGTVILVSSCSEGIGDRNFYDLLAGSDSPAGVIEKTDKEYRLGYHKAAKLAQLLQTSDIYAVTDINPELLKAVFFVPFSGLQQAFDAAVAKHRSLNGGGPTVVIVPDGSVTVPKIAAVL